MSPEDLKEWIFQRLLKKITSDINPTNQLSDLRVYDVLKEWQCSESFVESRISLEVEFDQSVLLWHIATHLCYYEDLNTKRIQSERDPKLAGSKWLSEYMLYLLVMRPLMLPNGIGKIRFQDTCAEAKEFFNERDFILNPNDACTNLFEVKTDIIPFEMKGDRSKSVLFDACRLANHLQSLEKEKQWEGAEKWRLISHVWIEMLCFAAAQCSSNDHAQQLRRGGEMLTHIWLLMAHLGLTNQFQISQGYARAKLVVK